MHIVFIKTSVNISLFHAAVAGTMQLVVWVAQGCLLHKHDSFIRIFNWGIGNLFVDAFKIKFVPNKRWEST